jgi:dTDP-4-amino-4,6-dideoxygalactose transaminase
MLSLPLHTRMSEADVHRVAQAIRRALRNRAHG